MTTSIHIPLSRPFMGEEEVEAVRQTLQSGWIAGQGPACARVERKIQDDMKTPYAAVISSCTAALHLALQVSGIGKGDEVLVSDYSFPATGHAVLYVGATPVFVDVDPATGNASVETLQAALTERTRAILLVHTFGLMADMEPIAEFAREHGLLLIEDAACAYGALDAQQQPPGRHSDIACFSFHARKNATSGEGGGLITTQQTIYDKVKSLTFFGVRSALQRRDAESFQLPEFGELGYNYKLSDIQASVLSVQLERLPQMLKERRKLAAHYYALLSDTPGVTLRLVADGALPSWQSFVVTLADGIDRNRVIVMMRERGIECQIGTYAMHLQPVYESRCLCPQSARLFRQDLALPLFVGLTESQQQEVVDALQACLK